MRRVDTEIENCLPITGLRGRSLVAGRLARRVRPLLVEGVDPLPDLRLGVIEPKKQRFVSIFSSLRNPFVAVVAPLSRPIFVDTMVQ